MLYPRAHSHRESHEGSCCGKPAGRNQAVHPQASAKHGRPPNFGRATMLRRSLGMNSLVSTSGLATAAPLVALAVGMRTRVEHATGQHGLSAVLRSEAPFTPHHRLRLNGPGPELGRGSAGPGTRLLKCGSSTRCKAADRSVRYKHRSMWVLFIGPVSRAGWWRLR